MLCKCKHTSPNLVSTSLLTPNSLTWKTCLCNIVWSILGHRLGKQVLRRLTQIEDDQSSQMQRLWCGQRRKKRPLVWEAVIRQSFVSFIWTYMQNAVRWTEFSDKRCSYVSNYCKGAWHLGLIKTVALFQQWDRFSSICKSLVQKATDVFSGASVFPSPSFLPEQVTAAPHTFTSNGFQIQYGVHCSHLVSTGRNHTGRIHVDDVQNVMCHSVNLRMTQDDFRMREMSNKTEKILVFFVLWELPN